MNVYISVVIPAYNAQDHIHICLSALRESMAQPVEVIVVDDGSTDGTVAIAQSFGATMLATGGRCGPARARNLGAKVAKGDVILFIDADVRVEPDTTLKVAEEFSQDPALDALMGSYDKRPAQQNFMSQYRNLMHTFVHRTSKREATTFWSGCGAIRRKVFLDFGGFDEKFNNAAIEDIDLGYRLHAAGHRLALNPDIEVKHLKHWSLRGLVKTDFFLRALPWSELVLTTGKMPNDLNLRMSQRVSVALSFIMVLLALYLTVMLKGFFLTPLFAIVFLMLTAYWMEATSWIVNTLMGVAMAGIVALAYIYHMRPIIPLVVVSWASLIIRHRYAYSEDARRRWTGVILGAFSLFAMGMIATYGPRHPAAVALTCAALVMIYLNKGFYLFLASRRGNLFAIASIPFHVLYYLYSGVAFMVASARHFARGILQRPKVMEQPAKSRTASAR